MLENSQLCVLMSCCVILLLQALPSGEDDEDDSDSDSDDDDVKVTIGNIKTGAPSYMWVLLGVGGFGAEGSQHVGMGSGDELRAALAPGSDGQDTRMALGADGQLSPAIACWRIHL